MKVHFGIPRLSGVRSIGVSLTRSDVRKLLDNLNDRQDITGTPRMSIVTADTTNSVSVTAVEDDPLIDGYRHDTTRAVCRAFDVPMSLVAAGHPEAHDHDNPARCSGCAADRWKRAIERLRQQSPSMGVVVLPPGVTFSTIATYVRVDKYGVRRTVYNQRTKDRRRPGYPGRRVDGTTAAAIASVPFVDRRQSIGKPRYSVERRYAWRDRRAPHTALV